MPKSPVLMLMLLDVSLFPLRLLDFIQLRDGWPTLHLVVSSVCVYLSLSLYLLCTSESVVQSMMMGVGVGVGHECEVTWVSSPAAAKVGAQCLQGSHQGNTACLVPSRIHLSTAKDTQRLPAVLYRDKEEEYISAFQVALPSLDRVQNRPLCKTKKNHNLHPKVLNST